MNIKQLCRALIVAVSALSTNLHSMNPVNSRPATSTGTGSAEKRSKVIPMKVVLQELNGIQTLIVPVPVLRDVPEILEKFKKYPITVVKVVKGTGKLRTLCLAGNHLTTLGTYFPNITALDLSDTRLRKLPSTLSSSFPKLTSLSLRNNNKLEPKLGKIVYSDLAKRLLYFNISNTKIDLTTEQLKRLFPNALVIRDTPNNNQQQATNTSASRRQEVEQSVTTSVATTTSRDPSLPPLLPIVSSNLQEEDTPCLTAAEENNNSEVTKVPRRWPYRLRLISPTGQPISSTPASTTSSPSIPQLSNAAQEQDTSSSVSSTSREDETRSLLRVILRTDSSKPLAPQADVSKARQAAKARQASKRNNLREILYTSRPTLTQAQPTSIVSKDELITALKDYLDEYKEIVKAAGDSTQDFVVASRLIALRTIKLPPLERLLTNYRNNGHILNLLLSPTTGLAHLSIEYANPELLELVINLEPDMLTSTHYANGYTPLELLLEKYPDTTGLQLLAILLKALQNNKKLDIKRVVTSRAVRQALQHSAFIQALTKTLVRIAYNDEKFKSKLIRMSESNAYTFSYIQDELLAYIKQYAGIPISAENEELIKHELQDIMRVEYLNPIEEQNRQQHSLTTLPLSLATSFYMLNKWIS